MKAVVQRVCWAKVSVDGNLVGQCGPGLLVLVAAHQQDTEATAHKLADRIAGLRIFNDPEGKMNLSLSQVESTGAPQILAISNFTLYGDCAKSRRPSFTQAAPFEAGKALYEQFVSALRVMDLRVETGIFGADMQVELLNDGPVTLIVEVEPPQG